MSSSVDLWDPCHIALEVDDALSIQVTTTTNLQGKVGGNKRKRSWPITKVPPRSTVKVLVDNIDVDLPRSTPKKVDDEGMKRMVWYIADFDTPPIYVGPWRTWADYQKAFPQPWPVGPPNDLGDAICFCEHPQYKMRLLVFVRRASTSFVILLEVIRKSVASSGLHVHRVGV